MRKFYVFFCLLILALNGFGEERIYLGTSFGFSDFPLQSIIKQYVTDGGNIVEIATEATSNANALGVGFISFIGESEHLIVEMDLLYKSSVIFSSDSSFQYKYSVDKDDTYEEGTLPSVTQYGHFRLGIGYNLTGQNSALIFAPMLLGDLEWGSVVYIDEAYSGYLGNNQMFPDEIRADATLLLGFSGKINAGLKLGDTGPLLLISPGIKLSWKLEESSYHNGIPEDPLETSDNINQVLSFEISASLLFELK